MSAAYLKRFDAIVHLAAHSSVAACEADPKGALDNNVRGFGELLQKMTGQKLIYASSGSVYDGHDDPADEDAVLKVPTNHYDFTKRVGDELARAIYPGAIGLRFGTVCGVSPRMRDELMIAAMIREAITQRELRLLAPDIWRPILGMKDLCRWIENAIRYELPGGVYNLASGEGTVAGIGDIVGQVTGARVFAGPTGMASYSFRMDTTKAATITPFEETIDSIVTDLFAHYRGRNDI